MVLPQEVAQQLAAYYALQPPLDIIALLRLLTIQVRVLPLIPGPTGMAADVIGVLARVPDWVMVVNYHAHIGQALAAAHLLGHYLLHADRVFACASSLADPDETEACAFADELVMPAAQVRALTVPITCNTARALGVPLVQLIRRHGDLKYEWAHKIQAERAHGEGPVE